MSQYMGIIYIPFKYKNLLIYEIKKIKNNKLHITNFLNKIIKKYYNVKIIETKDLWYEFDDVSDYESFFSKTLKFSYCIFLFNETYDRVFL